MQGSPGSVREKWKDASVARRYADRRFGSRRAGQRDPELVAALLARALPSPESVLDVPCGAGRLFPALAQRGAAVTGVDVSAEMLRGTPRDQRVVQADALALPFAALSFDAVVCCRLAHHLHARDDVARLFAELARVARRFVIVSFWDSTSLPAWRTRVGLKRSEGARGRVARSRREITELLRASALEPRTFRASFRFVSQQTFVLAERR